VALQVASVAVGLEVRSGVHRGLLPDARQQGHLVPVEWLVVTEEMVEWAEQADAEMESALAAGAVRAELPQVQRGVLRLDGLLGARPLVAEPVKLLEVLQPLQE
jgi:hypothetical protein